MRRTSTALAVVLALVGACGDAADEVVTEPNAGAPPDGFVIEVIRDDLVGPTQVVRSPDGELWLAELGGGENEGQGRVLRFVTDDGPPEVVLDGLDKPTGLAVTQNAVWVMQRRSLSRATRGADGALSGGLELVTDDLAFNGRSEGTLTPTSDGRLLFTETGIGSGGDASRPSGRLLAASLENPTRPIMVVAVGFKNAYAHADLPDRAAWLVTEIGDGQYDGEAPPDELNLVEASGSGPAPDGGWPRCIGAQVAVAEFGGSAEDCEVTTLEPLAVFPPRSTPTGVAAFDGVWLVSLWVEGRIVGVPIDGGEPTTWYLHDGPGLQHLVVDGDRLLVTDHLGGRLLAFIPEA